MSKPKSEMIKKSEYCLNCKMKPCSNKGCPLNNDIPNFIQKVKEDKMEDAYKILNNTTVLSAICGRICPHKRQCQGSCIRGIKGESVNIGDLEAYVGDYANNNGLSLQINKNNKFQNVNVAIIGGGPAGLTCAAFLAIKGVNVTIFEQKDYLGGLLIHGIPEFRLPKIIVRQTIDKILKLGIKVEYNMTLGKDINIECLQKKFNHIFIAIGANKAIKMGIAGENLNGVYSGNELLEYQNHPSYIGKTVIINGAGNVAMDIARTIKKMGAKKVLIVYRKTISQVPADEKEIQDVINEGIEFLYLHNIIKINGNKNVESVELIKTRLIKKESDSNIFVENIENTNYELKTDYVVMALGSKIDDKVAKTINLKLNNKYVEVDNNYNTSLKNVYAGGDLIGRSGTVAKAARDGRKVAEEILKKY